MTLTGYNRMALSFASAGERQSLNLGLKIILNVLGSCFLVLAILGVFLPLLPATPFLLLASACYLRGSERLHRWMMNHRLFGSYLKNIQQRRGIPVRAKIISAVLLWLSISYSIYSINIFLVEMLLILMGITSSIMIFRMKTLKESDRA